MPCFSRAWRTPLFLLCSALCCRAAADRELLALLPAETFDVVGVDTATLRAGADGQSLLDSVKARIPALTAIAGFDPARDVDSFVVAKATSYKPGHAVVLMRSSNGASLRSKIVAAFPSSETLNGITVQTLTQNGRKRAVALLTPTVFAAGGRDEIRTLLESRRQPRILDGTLVSGIEQTAKDNEVWYASSAPGIPVDGKTLSRFTHGMDMTQLLQSIRYSAAGLHVTKGAQSTFIATTRSPQDAAALADVFRFVSGMLRMQGGGHASLVSILLKNTQPSVTGSTMQLNGTISSEDFARVLQALPSAQK